MILDLADVKLHLRVDGSDEDSLITHYMQAAEQAAVDFLNRTIYSDQTSKDAADDADGVVATPAIEAALLLTTGRMYQNREDVVVGASAQRLPLGAAEDLLWPYRIGLGV